MEPADLKHFKRLEYLNLAINNISMVQGISHMEFLEKLDLTLNFIHLDSLKQSMEHLATLRSLKELYLMGNPCYYNGQEDKVHRQQHGCWSGYRDYVIAKLPQIISLDGKSITRSERNKARRMLPQLEVELSCLVQECKSDTTLLVQEVNSELEDTNHEDDPTLHCPQVRLQMSHEVAAQKAAKEKAQRANEPQIKGEQEALEEQQLVLERERARKREENGEIRQCNGMSLFL
jgi:protein TilB